MNLRSLPEPVRLTFSVWRSFANSPHGFPLQAFKVVVGNRAYSEIGVGRRHLPKSLPECENVLFAGRSRRRSPYCRARIAAEPLKPRRDVQFAVIVQQRQELQTVCRLRRCEQPPELHVGFTQPPTA